MSCTCGTKREVFRSSDPDSQLNLENALSESERICILRYFGTSSVQPCSEFLWDWKIEKMHLVARLMLTTWKYKLEKK